MSSHKPKVPTQGYLDKLRDSYIYDRSTGTVYNRKNPTLQRSANGNGYMHLKVTVDKKVKSISVHHIVWFLEYGVWPDSALDHINGDKSDNYYRNLRKCTNRENTQYYWNSKGGQYSKFLGVSSQSGGKSVRAVIRDKESNYWHLGTFKCELEAADAYDNALISMGFDPVNCRSSAYKQMKKDKDMQHED